MTRRQAPPDRTPVPAVAAAVLGLVSAAVAGVMALGLVGLGALTQDGAAAVLWLAGLVVAAVALAGVWLEYGEGLTIIGALAALPALALVLTLLPSVRRWAARAPTH
jgi:hypothetical protein